MAGCRRFLLYGPWTMGQVEFLQEALRICFADLMADLGLYFDQGLAPLAARLGDGSVYCCQNNVDKVSLEAPRPL